MPFYLLIFAKEWEAINTMLKIARVDCELFNHNNNPPNNDEVFYKLFIRNKE
jgi:hypothetical protein